MRVDNLSNPTSGRPIPNQFEIRGDDGAVVFQSYKTTIARIDREGVTLDLHALDYSQTTSKYLYQFLARHGYWDTNRALIKRRIKDGTFKTADLNEKE